MKKATRMNRGLDIRRCNDYDILKRLMAHMSILDNLAGGLFLYFRADYSTVHHRQRGGRITYRKQHPKNKQANQNNSLGKRIEFTKEIERSMLAQFKGRI